MNIENNTITYITIRGKSTTWTRSNNNSLWYHTSKDSNIITWWWWVTTSKDNIVEADVMHSTRSRYKPPSQQEPNIIPDEHPTTPPIGCTCLQVGQYRNQKLVGTKYRCRNIKLITSWLLFLTQTIHLHNNSETLTISIVTLFLFTNTFTRSSPCHV